MRAGFFSIRLQARETGSSQKCRSNRRPSSEQNHTLWYRQHKIQNISGKRSTNAELCNQELPGKCAPWPTSARMVSATAINRLKEHRLLLMFGPAANYKFSECHVAPCIKRCNGHQKEQFSRTVQNRIILRKFLETAWHYQHRSWDPWHSFFHFKEGATGKVNSKWIMRR